MEDNLELLAPFCEEFKDALFQMHSDKSSGLDGLNPTFYQKFWELCGMEIFNTTTKCLDEGVFPNTFNETNIVLVPKIDQPETMRDIYPISLCNVAFEILSNVLAN